MTETWEVMMVFWLVASVANIVLMAEHYPHAEVAFLVLMVLGPFLLVIWRSERRREDR